MRMTDPHATTPRVPTSARPASRAFVFVWRRMTPYPWEQTDRRRRSRHADDHRVFAPTLRTTCRIYARYSRGASGLMSRLDDPSPARLGSRRAQLRATSLES